MKRFQIVKFTLAGAMLALFACSPKVENHGYIKEGDLKDRLIVGQTTKDDVQTALGSPSAASTFGDDTWYYISSRRESVAFLKPQVAEQDVIRIVFDEAGVVSKVETYDKNSAKDIAIAKRTTPTEGHSMGIMEQFLGNIGRFNKPGSGTNHGSPGGVPGGY